MIKNVLLRAIDWYQKNISAGMPRRCRYYPTCSTYAMTAVRVHGPAKGTILAGWRLLRCNPLTDGGVDHVPARGHWRREPYVRPAADEYPDPVTY